LALYAAICYLRAGKVLYFVRVATYDVAASSNLQDSSVDKVDVEAVSTGTWGNYVQLTVSAGTDTDSWKLDVKEYNSASGTYEVVESFDNLLVGSGNVSDDNFIETRINGISDYITVTDSGASEDIDTGTVTLASGEDGTPVDASDIIGTVSGTTATGLQTLRNPSELDVNIIAVPGVSTTSVIAAMITVCTDYRKDCICLIDPPIGLTPAEVISWHNGLGSGNTTRWNSYYATIAGNQWVEMYDGYSAASIFVPPSGPRAYALAKGDESTEVWYAHAGPRRGLLPFATDLEYYPEEGDRILFRDNLNCVNAIVNDTTSGIMINDQLSCHRAYTALRDMNVVRMILYAMKVISTATQYLLWEPNDADTWRDFRNLVSPELEAIKSRRGLYDFRVICDASTNPSAQIDRGVMGAKLLLKPTRAASIISIEFDLLPTGADFETFA